MNDSGRYPELSFRESGVYLNGKRVDFITEILLESSADWVSKAGPYSKVTISRVTDEELRFLKHQQKTMHRIETSLDFISYVFGGASSYFIFKWLLGGDIRISFFMFVVFSVINRFFIRKYVRKRRLANGKTTSNRH